MHYNIYIKTKLGSYNLIGLTKQQLDKIVDVYLRGEKSVTISGTRHSTDNIYTFRIFQHDQERSPQEVSDYYLNNIHFRVKGLGNYYLPVETLAKMGREVTEDFIQDRPYGELKVEDGLKEEKDVVYIDESRIEDLKKLNTKKFDFTKLIQLCEEINDNFARGNYLSVAMIGRTILNHVPPIFNLKSFDEVTSNYGGPIDNKSFKKNMKHLNESLKNIADSHLHLQIREKETLPTETQVDFKQDLDVLIAEIIRISK